MTLLPSPRQPYVDGSGIATTPFHAWCSAVDRALNDGTLSLAALADSIAAVAASVPSLDSVLSSSTSVVGGPGISVSGSLATGAVILGLELTAGDGVTITEAGGSVVIAASGGVPYEIADGETYTVPTGIQALYTLPIDLGVGSVLAIDGALIEVD